MELWDRYSYRVSWSEEDDEFVAVCSELPGLSWLDKQAEKALRGIRRAAREAVQLLHDHGDPVPEPIAERRFSGIFKVRVPPEVHRRLALEAAEQNVSLNRIVATKLATPLESPLATEVREPKAGYRTRRSAATKRKG